MKSSIAVAVLFLVFGPVVGQDKQDDKQESAKLEKELLTQINQERSQQKRTALKPNDVLTKAARKQAEEFAKQNDIKQAADGKATLDRVKAVGYKYSAIGENTAFSNEGVEFAMNLWKNSDLHRNNMLLAAFSQVGIGAAKSSEGTWYFVVIFAAPARR